MVQRASAGHGFQAANITAGIIWAFFMMLPGYIGTTLAPLKPYYDKAAAWFW